jgi:hypothetical protein
MLPGHNGPEACELAKLHTVVAPNYSAVIEKSPASMRPLKQLPSGLSLLKTIEKFAWRWPGMKGPDANRFQRQPV